MRLVENRSSAHSISNPFPGSLRLPQAEIFQGGEVSRAEVMVLEETLKKKDKDLVEKNERIRQLETELAKMKADDLE